MMQEVPIHECLVGHGHENRRRLVVPTITCEFKPEPVDDRSAINLGSGVYNGPSESTPGLSGREVLLEEHPHVGGR